MNYLQYSALILICAFATTLQAQETPHQALLVLSKNDQTMSIVDPATLSIVGRASAGPDPHEVIASADGKFAYISNYGGGAYNTITPVDLQTQKALPVIDLGALRGPHGLTFVAGKLWFTAEGAKVIGSFDPLTQKIDWVMGTGQDRTHMLHVFPSANLIITSNVSSATLSVIEKVRLTPAALAARLLAFRPRAPAGPRP